MVIYLSNYAILVTVLTVVTVVTVVTVATVVTIVLKNPAYGRQSISRPMRIVAPMP